MYVKKSTVTFFGSIDFEKSILCQEVDTKLSTNPKNFKKKRSPFFQNGKSFFSETLSYYLYLYFHFFYYFFYLLFHFLYFYFHHFYFLLYFYFQPGVLAPPVPPARSLFGGGGGGGPKGGG